ncbi:MAG: DJ-1/PfpI family protein [Fibrobacter sp.]|nr:DJ-1/PfpI family protein [Fibrobacter sp.]
MQILFLMADGFEETEFVTPFDYLQRAGIDVALASVSGKAEVVGAHGLRIASDYALSSAKIDAFDGILLPGGGPGVKNLKASAEVEKVICDFNDQDKWIFAICAAPLVLSKAGILVDRTVTCFPGCEGELVCNKFVEDRVVVDGNIVTSRGAGTAEEFAFECIAQLGGRELAEKIRKQVVAR